MEDANIPIEKLKPLVKDLVIETITQLTHEKGVKVSDYSLAMRMVRVEEELKALKEVQAAMLREMTERFEAMDKRFEAMDKRFEALQREMDKRFEAMDKRFEAIDKRFNLIQWGMGIGFTTVIAFLIAILRFVVR